MKIISNDFREALRGIREIDTQITYNNNGIDTIIENETIKSVNPLFKVDLFRTVCKSVQIESQQNIPLRTWINLKIGVLVNEEYEYIDFGKYYIIDSTFEADTNTYLITAYDKMIESMINYDENPLDIIYPISVKQMIIKICEKLNWNYNLETFINDDKLIKKDLFSGLGLTYRDILDNLSEVIVGNLLFDNNDNLVVKYIDKNNPTTWDEKQVINEEDLKNVNVDIKTKYGKINTLIISSNNVVLNNATDYTSVEQNGKTEIKIDDNLILIFDNEEFIEEMFDYVNGLEYYLYDFDTIGLLFLEPLDKFAVKINDIYYPTICLNDDIKITSGLIETLYVQEPEINVHEYIVNDKETSKLNQTAIKIDKQNNKIELLSSQVVPVSNTIKGVRQIQLENAYEGRLHYLSIKGNISLLYPSSQEGLYGYALAPSETLTPSADLTPSTPVYKDNKILYPSNELFSKSSVLLIDDVEYKLDFNFLNYINDTDCDEFIYEDGKCKIIRRVGVDADGNLYATGQEVIENRKDIDLNIKYNSTIKLKSFDEAILKATYLLENEFTNNFVTEVDAIARINLSPGEAKLQANKIALEGYTTINNGFSVDLDGNMTANNGKFTGGEIILSNTQAEGSQNKSSKFKILTSDNENMYTTISSYSLNFKHEDYDSICSAFGISTYDHANNFHASLSPDDLYLGSYYSDCKWQAGEEAYLGMSDRYSQIRINGGIDPYYKITKFDSSNFSSMTPNGVWSPSFNNNSLESKKKNIDFDDGCLEEILNTDICSFNWKYEDDTDQKHIGCIIADESGNYKVSQKVLTHDKDAIDLYSMNGMSWKAIQELYDIIKLQERKIKELEERLDGVK